VPFLPIIILIIMIIKKIYKIEEQLLIMKSLPLPKMGKKRRKPKKPTNWLTFWKKTSETVISFFC
jgi:hypothetical protein